MYIARVVERNPFTFGSLACGDAFVDREDELRALTGDLRGGRDVLLLAPRRYGKSSLALRAVQEAAREGILVATCDLTRTPTKERFAAALAKTIDDDLASPPGQPRDRAAGLFRGLPVRPTIELDPDDGELSFSFRANRADGAIDGTIERLLELPGRIAAERERQVAILFDEFQEVAALDPRLPDLMRSVFQAQPDVAHVYVGSRRHARHAIFDDRDDALWRDARRMELGRLPHDTLAGHLRSRFAATARDADDEAVSRILEITDGHPYATQELAFFTWAHVPRGHAARAADVEAGLVDVLRAEHNNLARLWDAATRNERLVLLALRPGAQSLYAEETRERAGLPAPTFVQRAVTSLVREDVIEKGPDGRYRLAEPFLAEWLERKASTRLEGDA